MKKENPIEEKESMKVKEAISLKMNEIFGEQDKEKYIKFIEFHFNLGFGE